MMVATLPPSVDQKKAAMLSTMQLLGLVSEIGFLIALPAAIFSYSGAVLDHRFGTSPFLLIAGIALALASSTLAVWHRIKPFLQS